MRRLLSHFPEHSGRHRPLRRSRARNETAIVVCVGVTPWMLLACHVVNFRGAREHDECVADDFLGAINGDEELPSGSECLMAVMTGRV